MQRGVRHSSSRSGSSTTSREGRGDIAIAARSIDCVCAAGFLTFSMMLSTWSCCRVSRDSSGDRGSHEVCGRRRKRAQNWCGAKPAWATPSRAASSITRRNTIVWHRFLVNRSLRVACSCPLSCQDLSRVALLKAAMHCCDSLTTVRQLLTIAPVRVVRSVRCASELLQRSTRLAMLRYRLTHQTAGAQSDSFLIVTS